MSNTSTSSIDEGLFSSFESLGPITSSATIPVTLAKNCGNSSDYEVDYCQSPKMRRPSSLSLLPNNTPQKNGSKKHKADRTRVIPSPSKCPKMELRPCELDFTDMFASMDRELTSMPYIGSSLSSKDL